MPTIELSCSDNMTSLDALPDNSIDSIVTDPPYGISLLGKAWDYDVPSIDMWKKAYRVLKPGRHVLSFGGARTYHRLVCRMEDAGFEIRNLIPWITAQGFLKGLDISKQIDKVLGYERTPIGRNPNSRENCTKDNTIFESGTVGKTAYITEPASPEASEWDGWNVALSPCSEPICLARKPLSESTVVANVLKWGTGAINIKACMIGTDKLTINRLESWTGFGQIKCPKYTQSQQEGRMPKNVLFDESALGTLPDRVQGYFFCSKASRTEKNEGLDDFPAKQKIYNGQSPNPSKDMKDVEKRFTTKPQANHHVSVKPVKLMEYLVKLITRPGGVVLDPFMGSGTTGVASVINWFGFIGIEMDQDYFNIAEARIHYWSDKTQ